jgi:hypothetical protein
MHAVSIHDKNQDGDFRWLAVDLKDIVRVYEPQLAKSSWQCRDFWCMPETGGETRDDSSEGLVMNGVEFLRWADGWQQVIDGEFVGTLAGEKLPWLVILARDSSYYVVLATDNQTLNPIRKSFRDVRPDPESAHRYCKHPSKT